MKSRKYTRQRTLLKGGRKDSNKINQSGNTMALKSTSSRSKSSKEKQREIQRERSEQIPRGDKRKRA